jgi:hypothetical protein
MTAPAGIPDWLAQQDEAEREELAALGVAADTTAAPVSQAEVDALASRLLRAMGLVQRELEELRAARDREIAFISAQYGARGERLARRWTFLESAIKGLAQLADFGTKKSREVGFGTYGRRKLPARVVVEDEATALGDLTEHAPHAVRVTVTLPLGVARTFEGLLDLDIAAPKYAIIAPTLKHSVLNDGVDVAGVRVEPERDEPFARPQLPPER